MSNWQEKAVSVKNQTKELLERILEIRRQLAVTGGALPQPDTLFDSALKSLSQTEFNIAVCGEVSQGKSSFINALVGRSVLPTNEHPTTSQLFRISSASVEKYRFIFTDGTEKEFSDPEDMLRYGTVLSTQESVDAKVIDYIDVQLPTQELPRGVHIWDTPGLGVSHVSHEEITARCVSRCDAVIFLSQPKAPLTDKEGDFIDNVLSVTGNICFVQTFADEYDETSCAKIATRNVEILEKRFGERFRKELKMEPQFHFVCCSSKNLMLSRQADTEQKRELLFRRSRFDAVFKELGEFFFQTICLRSVVQACSEYVKLHNKCMTSLSESRKALSVDAQVKKGDLVKAKKDQLTAFSAQWDSAKGASYLCLKSDVNLIIKTAKSKAAQLFSRNSYLLDKYIRLVQALPDSPGEVQSFFESVKTDLPNELSLEWQKIVDKANSALYDRFEKFEVEFNGDAEAWDAGGSGTINYEHKGLGAFTAIRNGTIGFSVVGGLALKAIALAPLTGGLSLAVAGIAALASAIWGAKKSISLGASAAAERAKVNLQRSLANYFADIQREYAVGDVGVESKIDSYFNRLHENAMASISSIVETERQNLKSSCARIEEQAAKVGEEASQELSAIDVAIAKLSDEKKKMIALMEGINRSE